MLMRRPKKEGQLEPHPCEPSSLDRADLRDPSGLTHVGGALLAGESPDLA